MSLSATGDAGVSRVDIGLAFLLSGVDGSSVAVMLRFLVIAVRCKSDS